MSKPQHNNRPLSPHLGVYRWQLSAVSSILIRITGVGLALSLALIVAWLFAASSGAAMFGYVDAILNSWLGRLVMILSLWGVCYHLLGGIRHLIFDLGYGLDMRHANRMGWAMVFGSFILWALVLIILRGVL